MRSSDGKTPRLALNRLGSLTSRSALHSVPAQSQNRWLAAPRRPLLLVGQEQQLRHRQQQLRDSR